MLRIPRTFHRIWLGSRPMPLEFVEFGISWLAHHPGWNMHTWTDAHAAGLANRETMARSVARSGKANVLRYEILWRYGGVYVDTDFECRKNLEPLLENVSCFVGLQSPGLANNAIIGSVPAHPFLHDLVANVHAGVRTHRLSIKQSGPYYLTERLRGRRDVTVFPTEYFYPYQWHERWRRHEHFPGAYGVHHWSLSWRKHRISTPCVGEPELSVLLINSSSDAQRLTWALEGLCQQTASGRFDVVVMDHSRSEVIRRTVQSYGGRLRVHYLAANPPQRGLLGEEIQRCAASCRAPRIILLDGHCVPDPGLVQSHAELGGGATAGFSSQRVYPPEKLFSFVPPLDYDALRMHAVADPRLLVSQSSPLSCDWRVVTECCISAPRSSILGLRIPPGLAVSAGAKWLARELLGRGHELLAMPDQARVTRLA